MKPSIRTITALTISLVLAIGIWGCASYGDYNENSETSGLQPPPPWEQGRMGDKLEHYEYWPQVKVYRSEERKVYYYFYQGQWQVASQLPNNVRVSGRSVGLEMYGEEPFKWQPEVERRYPQETK